MAAQARGLVERVGPTKRRKVYLRDPAVGVPRRTRYYRRQRHNRVVAEDPTVIPLNISSSSTSDTGDDSDSGSDISEDISGTDYDTEDEGSSVDSNASSEECDTATPTTCKEKPLYSGAPEGLTEYMALLLLFRYSTRHSLTSKALKELLHLLIVFLPHDARVHKTVKQLKQVFLHKYPEQCPAMQKYCELCQRLLEKDEACACNAGHAEFVLLLDREENAAHEYEYLFECRQTLMKKVERYKATVEKQSTAITKMKYEQRQEIERIREFYQAIAYAPTRAGRMVKIAHCSSKAAVEMMQEVGLKPITKDMI